ncbi:MAG: lipid-A-disaccharide synthase [Gemmatimonadaceae bacterium]
MPEILIIAGEASGDLHAARVAHELVAAGAPFDLVGIGGDAMQAAGVRLLEHARGLAALGLVEVIGHVPRHYALLRQLRRRLKGGSIALLVLVDYPGFNMRVAAAAAAAGVPVLYYITPQVWAWGSARAARLAKIVSKAAVILPFEEQLLRSHGVDATFVGHPLLDAAGSLPTRADARAALGIAPTDRVLALFPGSRPQEITRHLDDFVATARELQRRLPALRVVVSAAPTVRIDAARCPFPLIRSASFSVLRAADAALCKSGTTTLEAAVADCPLVVAYRTSRITYAAARRVLKIRHIGLVNVVAGREIAPEFVQDGLRPDAVAAALFPLLDPEAPQRTRMLADLRDVRSALGTPGASRRVAALALALATRAGRAA